MHFEPFNISRSTLRSILLQNRELFGKTNTQFYGKMKRTVAKLYFKLPIRFQFILRCIEDCAFFSGGVTTQSNFNAWSGQSSCHSQ